MYYRDQGVSVSDVFDPQDQLWVNDIITAAIRGKNERRISRFRVINVGGRPKVLAQQPKDKQYKELLDPLAWLTRRPVAAKVGPGAQGDVAGGVPPAAAQPQTTATDGTRTQTMTAGKSSISRPRSGLHCLAGRPRGGLTHGNTRNRLTRVRNVPSGRNSRH